MKTPIDEIQRACDIVGGQAALARILDVEPTNVWQWLNGKRQIPARFCAAVEAATSGEVTRQSLRPDDWQQYWPELKAA